MRRVFLPVAILVIALVHPMVPAVARPTPSGTFTGTLAGADYEIRVPEDWNGTLLVYAHGYAFDRPDAEAAPDPALAEALLAQGYALAGSSYSAGGWAVKEGVADTRTLTQRFNGLVGKPDRTILYGFSMGSLVAYESAERFPGIYDGSIAFCAVGAGAPEAWDGSLALSLALDAVGWWDTEAWGPPSDVRDDLVFGEPGGPVDVADQFAARVFADAPAVQQAKLLFLQAVTDVIPWLGPDGQPTDLATLLALDPASQLLALTNTLTELTTWLFTDLYFGTQARGELEARAGGPVVQNLDDEYVLDGLEGVLLQGLGVPYEPWLASMNATEVAPVPNARNYVEHHADYTGRIRMPVLSVHTWVDGLVPPAHQSAYAETVEAAGRGDMLVQAYADGFGHCAFEGPQLVEAILAMDGWLATGSAPDPTAFAADGWLDGYTPPPWPY